MIRVSDCSSSVDAPVLGRTSNHVTRGKSLKDFQGPISSGFQLNFFLNLVLRTLKMLRITDCKSTKVLNVPYELAQQIDGFKDA